MMMLKEKEGYAFCERERERKDELIKKKGY